MSSRIELMNLLGAKCAECGEVDYDMLQVDHVQNNGFLDRMRFGNNEEMYSYYLLHIAEARLMLQVLCANHNWKKRGEARSLQAKIKTKMTQAPSIDDSTDKWEGFLNTCDANELLFVTFQAEMIAKIARRTLMTGTQLELMPPEVIEKKDPKAEAIFAGIEAIADEHGSVNENALRSWVCQRNYFTDPTEFDLYLKRLNRIGKIYYRKYETLAKS